MLIPNATTDLSNAFRFDDSEGTEQDEEVKSKFELKARDPDEPPSSIHASDPAGAAAKSKPFGDQSDVIPHSNEDDVSTHSHTPSSPRACG